MRTARPSAWTAGTRQAQTTSPSSQTEHEPHSPCSQAFFVADQPEVVAQERQQARAGRDLDLVRRAVHGQRDRASGSSSGRRASSSSSAAREALDDVAAVGRACRAGRRSGGRRPRRAAPNSSSSAGESGALRVVPGDDRGGEGLGLGARAARSARPSRARPGRPAAARRAGRTRRRSRSPSRFAARPSRTIPARPDGADLDAGDQLVGAEARLLGPERGTRPTAPMRVPRGRGERRRGRRRPRATGRLSPAGEAVARLPPIVARLRICARADRPRRLGERRQLRQLGRDPRERHAGADEHRAVAPLAPLRAPRRGRGRAAPAARGGRS